MKLTRVHQSVTSGWLSNDVIEQSNLLAGVRGRHSDPLSRVSLLSLDYVGHSLRHGYVDYNPSFGRFRVRLNPERHIATGCEMQLCQPHRRFEMGQQLVLRAESKDFVGNEALDRCR